ncbi:hypothetical protein [Rhizobium sp. 007]|uniref:hypothetical protein n=1 Tax=Rhizobium sp. 007 TaxID=2785056 RepID=UPI00189029FE|nr:hypothetical protein [Rhizobium sp. 007]QPB24783.1 hypothetical protein ISN39_35675 [Rhizobium sp. 007]
MTTLRFENSSTNGNLSALIDVLQAPGTKKLTFFASATSSDDERLPEGTTNLPVLSALAECVVPGLGNLEIVYDGNFLNAQRTQRASEIGVLLDAAVNGNQIFYGSDRAPFTSKLSAEEAAETLKKIPSFA